MTSNYACISALDLAWEDYKESPSRKDGISDAMERYHRASGCRFIFDCGNALKLDRIVQCTACVFFQSFYMRESMTTCERYQYAAAALYLAAKTNDQPRLLYDVVNVLHMQKNLKRKRTVPPLDKKSSECIHKLNMLKDAELKLSQTLEFEFDIDLPHAVFTKQGLVYLKQKFPDSFKLVARKTVILLGFSLHSVASLLYPPSFICCATMQLAANIHNQKGEPKLLLPKFWYKHIEPTMNEDILEYLVSQINAVTDESEREGYRCPVDYTKIPEKDAKEWEMRQQTQHVQKPSAPVVGRKRPRYPDIDGPAPSPINYPTPSPHSRGNVVSEWTLYVGNLPAGATQEKLKEAFGSTGLPVKSAKVMKNNREDRSSRYGFVSFLSKSDMETALIDFKDKEIEGVKISIQRAAVEERNPKRRKQNNVKLKGRPPQNFYGQGPMYPRPHHSSQWKSTNVFIGYLPPEATEAQIREACSAAFGRVAKVRIMRDPQKRSLGYGFIHFVNSDGKMKALKKGSVQISGGKSCIIKSTRKDQDEQGPFTVRITAFHEADKPYWKQHITKQVLAKYFMHLGAISEIEITNQAASIEFYQKEVQKMAINLSGQTIVGGKNKKRWSIAIKIMEDTRPKPTGERSVFVPGVENSLTKQEVFQAFINFGAIESVSMSKETDSSNKKDAKLHTIITYKNRESQIKAIESKQIVIKDRRYDIKRYKTNQEIENEHKVLVLNLPKDLTSDQLAAAMRESFGQIVRTHLKLKSGSGIVQFKSKSSADKACREGRLRISNYVVFIQPFENLVVGRTLHVGNLPKVASENEVQAYFESLLPSNHGIQQLKIKMPCVNVIFQTQAKAETAFSSLRDKVFKGNRLDVEFHQRHNNRHKNVQDDVAKTIWIAGLNPNVKDLRRKIEVKCSIMGPVINVHVHNKKVAPNATQWATVTFDHIESAQKAVAQMNGREFLGSTWTVRPYGRTKSPGPMGHQPISPSPFHFPMNPPVPHPQFPQMGPPPLQHFPKGNFRSPVPRNHKNGFQDRKFF